MQQMNSLQDLMSNMLTDIYKAEQQALEGMPQMAEHCESDQLKKVFQEHEKHTQKQCQRLEEIFQEIGQKVPKGGKEAVVSALVKEAQQMIKSGANPDVLDAAMILAAQKIEHIEIASYGTAVEFAKMTGQKRLAKLLAENLDEEEKMDKKLTRIAKSSINPKAKQN